MSPLDQEQVVRLRKEHGLDTSSNSRFQFFLDHNGGDTWGAEKSCFEEMGLWVYSPGLADNLASEHTIPCPKCGSPNTEPTQDESGSYMKCVSCGHKFNKVKRQSSVPQWAVRLGVSVGPGGELRGWHPKSLPIGYEPKAVPTDYSIQFGRDGFDLELHIPEEVLWWDDGNPGGGDWIATQSLNSALEEPDFATFNQLGVTEDQLTQLFDDRIKSIPVENTKAREFLKKNAEGDSTLYFKPDKGMLGLEHGRLPCPECGGMIEAEPDADSAYCHDCGKVVHWKNPMG